MGTINPLGNTVKEFWRAIRAGENGISVLDRFDCSEFPARIAGQVRDFAPDTFLGAKEARRMDRFTQFAMVASAEAMTDAGLEPGAGDSTRFGVILGNGIGGIETLEAQAHRVYDKGPKAMHPLFVPMMIANEAAGNVAIKHQAYGPSAVVVTACASSNDAIGSAWKTIRDGTTDVMIAGGTEAPLTPLALAGFCQLQAVSTRNDDPSRASRPFDKERDGFVMSEGAGVLVLEELEHAKRRGARIYAELAGYGATCDANHLTAPHPEGRGAIRAILAAVETAGLAPSDVDYVNAHGTSTPINDPIETRAIKAAFGDYARTLKVSSSKSMHGHLLGAAGGVEAIVSIMAIKDQFFPPTRNMDHADPACDLDYVPHTGRDGRIRAAISNALGFGGHNSVVLFKEWAG
jgi:3-oxoacyl-[acyl-carrier-protein] synthase II